MPGSIHSLRLEGLAGSASVRTAIRSTWPIAKLAGGGKTDLSIAQSPDSGIGDKLFAGPLNGSRIGAPWSGHRHGLRINVQFDTAATPYLGLWICYGGWPDRPGPKQTCVAMEPATAPVDSLAETGPWSRELAPGACVRMDYARGF